MQSTNVQGPLDVSGTSLGSDPAGQHEIVIQPTSGWAALLPWDFFSDAVGSGTNSLLGSMSLISKVYFPRLIVPLSQVISGLVDFAISFIVLAGMMIVYQIQPTWGVLLLPFYLLLAAMTGL